MEKPFTGSWIYESGTVDRVTLPFTFQDLEEAGDQCEEVEGVEFSGIGAECFNFPDEIVIESTIRFSDIDIDYDAMKRLMFD